MDGTNTSAVSTPRLMVHRIGRPESEDQLLLHFPEDDEIVFYAELSHDDRWVVVSINKGTEYRNRLWALPVTNHDGRSEVGAPERVVDDPVAELIFVRTDGDDVVLQTDLDAPLGRVVRVPVGADALASLVEIVPEGRRR